MNADGVEPLPPIDLEKALPIIFVHGFAGSAQQYESQAQRFVANGYPIERIRAYDHDGAGLAFGEYVDGVEAAIDQALSDFDVEQVYLVGHSRGTSVSNMYLGDEARAAKVAKYIALDGSSCVDNVPCIEPSQDTPPDNIPGQAHVEVATSAESFAIQYEFLMGEAPAVTEIVAQVEPVELMGRAVNFPANTGRAGVKLEIWELNDETGHRAYDAPNATFTVAEDGSWGPVKVDSRKHYEFALSAEEGSTHHIYLQRYLRDSHFVRLLSGDTMSATRVNTNTSDKHTALILMRMREWYAVDDDELDGDQTDVLEVSATSASGGDTEATDLLADFIANGTIGIHVHDAASSPEDSTLEPLPYFSAQAFQSGVDFFIPAADPPDGTITLTNIPRGDTDNPQVMRIPNWISSANAVTVQFADYAQ